MCSKVIRLSGLLMVGIFSLLVTIPKVSAQDAGSFDVQQADRVPTWTVPTWTWTAGVKTSTPASTSTATITQSVQTTTPTSIPTPSAPRSCPGDIDGNGSVSVSEVVSVVNNLLYGCK